ncbi:MAG: RNA polymerase sigma factor [Deltaproteobacteria bacterium]
MSARRGREGMDIDTPTRELIERAAAGDAVAQSQLVDPCLEVVINWAARLCGPRLDPEDIAHEVFIVALTKLGSLKDPTKFNSWLYGITRKTVAKYRRRAWIKKWVGAQEEIDVADDAPGPAMDVIRKESSDRIRRLMERVPAKQREVLILVHVEGRSGPEVAEMLGIPEGTVRGRLRLGKNKLLQLLEAEGIDPPGARNPKPAKGSVR